MAALAEKPQVVSVRFAEARATAASAPVDLITCEYEPSIGGIADYSREIAKGLVAAGIPVRVWSAGAAGREQVNPMLAVNRSFGKFGFYSLLKTGWAMRRAGGGKTVLLEWEPVGYGAKSLNLPFCLWMCWQALCGTKLIVMFHETFLSYAKRTPTRFAAATIQRLMAFLLINFATKTFASTESGVLALDKLNLRNEPVEHLPVFSNIHGNNDPDYARHLRRQFVSQDEILIGHFGRYNFEVEQLLLPATTALLRKNPKVQILFAGECGDFYRNTVLSTCPELAYRIHSAGVCTDQQAASVISACDFMFQPYPDGITTRRSTTMAALRNGRLIVSNKGTATEQLWNDTKAVHLIDARSADEYAWHLSAIADDSARIVEGSNAAHEFYENHFSVERTLRTLLACVKSS